MASCLAEPHFEAPQTQIASASFFQKRSFISKSAYTGFPTRRTWIKAIKKGNFIDWPMLTVENVNTHFPESEETVNGHMDHQQQGVRSTKPNDFQEPDVSNEIEKKENGVYIKVVDLCRELYNALSKKNRARRRLPWRA